MTVLPPTLTAPVAPGASRVSSRPVEPASARVRSIPQQRRSPRDEDLAAQSHEPGERGRRSREELVRRYRPLVHAEASRFARRGGRERDDLVSQGWEGLLKAVRDFDPGRGVHFAAYARAKVHGEMLRWLRDTRYSVHVPRPLHERAMQVRRARADLESRTGRAPTTDDVAATLDCPVEDVLEAMVASSADRARRAVLTDALARSFGDVLPDVDLAAAVAHLSEQQGAVVRARYVEGLSQREVGERIGLSQPQVSRIESAALGHLRAELAPRA